MSYYPRPSPKRKIKTAGFQHAKGYKFTNIGQDPKRGYLGLYDYPKKILQYYGYYQKYKKYTPYYYQDWLESKIKFESNRYVFYDKYRKLWNAKTLQRPKKKQWYANRKYRAKLQKGFEPALDIKRCSCGHKLQYDYRCRFYCNGTNKSNRWRRSYR